jgi:hypothetical protein
VVPAVKLPAPFYFVPFVWGTTMVPVDEDLLVERSGPVRLAFACETFVTEVTMTGWIGPRADSSVDEQICDSELQKPWTSIV